MSTLSELQADLDAINEIIEARRATGHVRAVSARGKSFQYESTKELFELRQSIRDQISRSRGPATARVALPRRRGR